jgi:maleate isomerase
MITPSSNTVLEPITIAMTADLYPRVTTHYTRIEVKTISLEAESLAHFKTETLVHAAQLLADAGMDVIAWNGTSGAWHGLDADRELCAAIVKQTGIPSTTATLAQLKAFAELGVRRYGLAVPYLASVRDAIIRTYAEAGFECCGSAHLGISANVEFAHVSSSEIRQLVRSADSAAAQAIAIVCTNLQSGWLVEDLEAGCGKPVLDSTVVTLWDALRLARIQEPIAGWGRLMRTR